MAARGKDRPFKRLASTVLAALAAGAVGIGVGEYLDPISHLLPQHEPAPVTAEADPEAVQGLGDLPAWQQNLSDGDKALLPITAYIGESSVSLNGGVPMFDGVPSNGAFEDYSPLDELGRCGAATACLGEELMPESGRGSIGSVTPTGWQESSYPFIDGGGNLYTRAHLIAFSLAGENANERNLITGTRYFNGSGMLWYETLVLEYIRQTHNHVLYRVTPVYEGDNLVASGVQMEAKSVEDGGAGIQFNAYVYNCQPGVVIDYATGLNWLAGVSTRADRPLLVVETPVIVAAAPGDISDDASQDSASGPTYVVNVKGGKFHYATCESVAAMNVENRQPFYGTREELIAQGLVPCGSCKP